ncbi:unnamed protein product [Closterium sp. NIES-54]
MLGILEASHSSRTRCIICQEDAVGGTEAPPVPSPPAAAAAAVAAAVVATDGAETALSTGAATPVSPTETVSAFPPSFSSAAAGVDEAAARVPVAAAAPLMAEACSS